MPWLTRFLAALTLLLSSLFLVGVGADFNSGGLGGGGGGGGGTTKLGCWTFTANAAPPICLNTGPPNNSTAVPEALADCHAVAQQTDASRVFHYWPDGTIVNKVTFHALQAISASSQCLTRVGTVATTAAVPTLIAGLSWSYPVGSEAAGVTTTLTLDPVVTKTGDQPVALWIEDDTGTCTASGTMYESMVCFWGSFP